MMYPAIAAARTLGKSKTAGSGQSVASKGKSKKLQDSDKSSENWCDSSNDEFSMPLPLPEESHPLTTPSSTNPDNHLLVSPPALPKISNDMLIDSFPSKTRKDPQSQG